ncbi:hypothetical protein MY3296_009867 [Beauveria thailandica]
MPGDYGLGVCARRGWLVSTVEIAAAGGVLGLKGIKIIESY